MRSLPPITAGGGVAVDRRPRRSAWLAVIGSLAACGHPPAAPAAPPERRVASKPVASKPRVARVVHADATAIVRDTLAGRSTARLPELTRAFYADHGDDYDFLYLVPTSTQAQRAMGRLITVRAPSRPWLGAGPTADEAFGSPARLKAVIALDYLESGSGPMLHELFHWWGVFLDRRFGFGAGRAGRVGPHWGFASVHGQVGGFAEATLACAGGEPLPCRAGAGGRISLVASRPFSPYASGGDSVPYAPLELYLMGLSPADQVPPTLVLDDAEIVDTGDGEAMRLTAAAMHRVTVAELAAVHGQVPPAAQTSFRVAFVVVSEATLDDAAPAVVVADRWARRLAGDLAVPRELSFAQATGGRATMDTRP